MASVLGAPLTLSYSQENLRLVELPPEVLEVLTAPQIPTCVGS